MGPHAASLAAASWPAALPAHLAGQAACFGAALVVTLVLAAWCTPRAWWRRPNLQALSVAGAGTVGFGLLFAALFGLSPLALPGTQPGAHLDRTAAARLPALALPVLTPAAPDRPAPGARWRVVDTLNLRSSTGIVARRVAVLPAGAIVVATGRQRGDWWEVRATVDGRAVPGWASSLWLRRPDEAAGKAPAQAGRPPDADRVR